MTYTQDLFSEKKLKVTYTIKEVVYGFDERRFWKTELDKMKGVIEKMNKTEIREFRGWERQRKKL